MPPFVGVAVKVTEVPAQILSADLDMDTLTGYVVPHALETDIASMYQ